MIVFFVFFLVSSNEEPEAKRARQPRSKVAKWHTNAERVAIVKYSLDHSIADAMKKYNVAETTLKRWRRNEGSYQVASGEVEHRRFHFPTPMHPCHPAV